MARNGYKDRKARRLADKPPKARDFAPWWAPEGVGKAAQEIELACKSQRLWEAKNGPARLDFGIDGKITSRPRVERKEASRA